MKKSELIAKTATVKSKTNEALQIVWDNTNKGQRNKMLKNEKIKAVLDRYGVNYKT